MEHRFKCQNADCSEMLRTDISNIGKRGTCKKCGTKQIIPNANAPATKHTDDSVTIAPFTTFSISTLDLAAAKFVPAVLPAAKQPEYTAKIAELSNYIQSHA